MRLTKGTRVGPYEVLSALGSGGMAEVYRARDTRLGRDIALKVVNEALAADPDLVRRFDQEARLAGSLNHPNLVAVYDVGLHDGVPFFVTELLNGESLRQRLGAGRIPLDRALDWAGQLAEGLAAAHARGIVHRDVKPENAFVTTDGHVKLLDFGIAKLAQAQHQPAASRGLLDETITPDGHETRTGAIIGTPAYMSPEQVQGGRVDARTDVFSLGAVLHEMISGKRPFSGASTLERAHAIVHEEPAPLPTASPLVAQVVRRCLAKDPDARFQSARDLAFALEMLRDEPRPGLASRPSRSRARIRDRWWIVGAALGALVTAGIVFTRLRPAAAPAPSSISIETVTLRTTGVIGARFTPDGRVVFSANDGAGFELFERNLTSSSVQPLGQKNVVLASISRKGEFAVFLPPLSSAMGLTAGPLARVAAGGGTPRVIADEIVSADWAPSGELAVIRRMPGLYTVEFPIGKVLFKSSGREWLGSLRVSPGGDLLAFMRHPTEGFIAGDVLIVDLQGKTRAVSKFWGRADGVAWPAQKEVWFAAGEKLPTQLQALPLDGPERTVYSSIVAFYLNDVARDGTTLIYVGQLKTEIGFLRAGASVARSLAWTDRNWFPLLTPDGQGVLFSAFGPAGEAVALLRKTIGTPPEVLGEGLGMAISRDGRWALLEVEDGLTMVPTGAGTPKFVPFPGISFGAARWVGEPPHVVATGRASTDPGFRLYSLNMNDGSISALSTLELNADGLEISPDQQRVAALDRMNRPVIHPLDGGSPVTLTELEIGWHPAGWANDEELWLARGQETGPAVIQLMRFNVRRHLKLEERVVPAVLENGGTGSPGRIHVTPDGKNLLFSLGAFKGHLYVIRGLPTPGR